MLHLCNTPSEKSLIGAAHIALFKWCYSSLSILLIGHVFNADRMNVPMYCVLLLRVSLTIYHQYRLSYAHY